MRRNDPNAWVFYNPMTATYDTPEGTSVAAELIDNASCLADVLHIASIREQQRKQLKAEREGHSCPNCLGVHPESCVFAEREGLNG